jgi:tetratricopeptide (TPR) repeat protein
VASLALLSGVWCFGRGDYALAQSRLAQAKKDPASRRLHLDAALTLDPTNPEAYFQRGIMVLDTLNGEQRLPDSQLLKTAARDLEQAVTLNPFNYLYRLALADALDAQGQPDKALQAIQRAIQLAPLHEEPRLALGLHWHGLGQWEKAEAAYLWAARARAMNKAGTANWLSSYHMLLEQLGLSH